MKGRWKGKGGKEEMGNKGSVKRRMKAVEGGRRREDVRKG